MAVRPWIAGLLLMMGCVGAHADAERGASEEIEGLIEAVRDASCRFQRNGDWHDAEAAADHLARKYRVARLLGREGTAEDFIEQAATRSSVSGEAYRVQCGEAPPRPSADWLREHLAAFRDQAEAAQ